MYYKKKKKRNYILFISVLFVLFVTFILLNNKFSIYKYNYLSGFLQDIFLVVNKTTVDDKSINNNYDNLLKEVELLKKENENLKQTLDINTTLYNKEYIVSTVINRSLNYWYDSITIDKGKKDGVKSDQAVTYKGYLVGKTTKVSNHSTTIRLLTSNQTNNKISVKLKIDNDFVYGLLSNYNKEKNYYLVEGISSTSSIEKDQILYTTGFSDIFPSDIEIGKVSKIKLDNFGLSYIIYVKPSINMDDIDYVTVLSRV